MIQAFESYIKTIVMLMVFSAFVLLIVPNNSFKKFISLVFGLILLSTMIKPFAGIRSATVSGANLLWSQVDADRQQLIQSYSHVESAQAEKILAIYQKELAAKTWTLLESALPEVAETVADIEFTICSDWQDTRFGLVEYITVSRLEETESFGAVKKVLLGETYPADSKELINQRIKNTLSDFYNLSTDNIYITVQKKNGVIDDG